MIVSFVHRAHCLVAQANLGDGAQCHHLQVYIRVYRKLRSQRIPTPCLRQAGCTPEGAKRSAGASLPCLRPLTRHAAAGWTGSPGCTLADWHGDARPAISDKVYYMRRYGTRQADTPVWQQPR